jgi:hypothetical protein
LIKHSKTKFHIRPTEAPYEHRYYSSECPLRVAGRSLPTQFENSPAEQGWGASCSPRLINSSLIYANTKDFQQLKI